jgi:hypothetical protein
MAGGDARHHSRRDGGATITFCSSASGRFI